MKKAISVILVLAIGYLVWYFLIKPYDYLVTFKADTTAGTINQSLKIWNKNLKNSHPIHQDNLYSLTQKINVSDSTHIYNWEIKAINDSVSKVKIYITDKDHSFQNKMSMPFSTTDFEKRTKNTIIDFVSKLKGHLDKIKVSKVEESETKATYCAYVSLKGLQVDKARGMMQYYSSLSSILNSNKVKLNGTPFIEVTNWNIEKDSIAYNFCFPIIKSDSLPKAPFIKYKNYKSVKALKVVYNGNYITSDRAWYTLLEHAKRNNIAVREMPIEVFYNNPNYGGDALQWKAEIYMPLKK